MLIAGADYYDPRNRSFASKGTLRFGRELLGIIIVVSLVWRWMQRWLPHIAVCLLASWDSSSISSYNFMLGFVRSFRVRTVR